MNNKIFDLEQEILDCWKVTDDISMVTKHFIDDPKWQDMSPALADAIMNKLNAIQELYELKFDRVWGSFEEVCKEYHTFRKFNEANSDERV